MFRTLPIVVAVTLGLGRATGQSGWIQRTPPIALSARCCNLLEYDLGRGVTVLFGGWVSGPIGDTWEWDGTAWSARLTANSPPARSGAAHGFDLGRMRVVLFGGQGTSGDLGDTWEYDGNNWLQFTPPVSPSARVLAGMAYDMTGSRSILFGGSPSVASTMLADMWAWNGASWQQLQPAHLPPGRWSFGMATDYAHARVVLHGGSSAAGNFPAPVQDTWSWDGTDWQQIATAVTPTPMLAFGFTYDWLRNVPVRFGGFALSGPGNNETWLLAGDTWVRDARPGLPSPRWNSTLAFDLLRGRTVMFGGFVGGSLQDTWEYVASGLATFRPYGAGCAGSAGVPQLQPVASARPLLGTMFPLELRNVPASALAAVAIGFSNSTWSGGLLPSPLASLGMPGCTLHASTEFLFAIQAVAGRATLSWPLPNVPSFAGVTFYVQAIALDPGSNAFGAVVSNAGAVVAGVF